MINILLPPITIFIIAIGFYLISYKISRLEDQLNKISDSHFDLAKNYLRFKENQLGKK